MALLTHVAPHPDALVSLLCEQLAVAPDDPFTPEVVAVPTRGIERWLTQRIASDLAARGVGDGICANVEFPSPARLVGSVLAVVPVLAGSAEAWEGSALVGHVVDAVDGHLGEPWLRLLERYLDTPTNRLAAGDKVARLFTRYSRRRPEMIRSWARGDDVGPGDRPMGEADIWQPRLWRIVREEIGVASFPEMLPGALDPIRSGKVDSGLPQRIAVYGLTSTDPLDLEVLVALSHRHDVHLYLLHPSPALWASTAEEIDPRQGLVDRADDDTASLSRHPLLAAWATESRELQVVLEAHGLRADSMGHPPTNIDRLLGRLQDDLRRNRPPVASPGLAEAVAVGQDRSIQVHVCHGSRRQVEVLRDAICHLLAADLTLEPRDIVIMTPDLDTFAPLLESGFPGADTSHSDAVPDMRLRIADRSPSATNPLVRLAAVVLDLVSSRIEAGAVRELMSRPLVQNRFGFDSATAGEIVALIDDADVSWGIDADHRQAWGAGSNDQRTWRRALDRTLAGVFYSDSAMRVVGDTVPLGGIEGQEARPAGLLAQILDRLVAITELLAPPRPMSEWASAIADSILLLAVPAWGDDWQLAQLQRLLTETFPPAREVGADPVVTLAEARQAISTWTEDRPSPLHFRSGDITVCTLVPMRSVPYRVVCLLGMDDERFPRTSRADGDDLLLGHEMVGDYDRGAQDRQLLLDAVMAAGDHLVVTYSGRDELTNAEFPPAVPIVELTDLLGEMVGTAAENLVVTHPLQSFSRDNFVAGKLLGTSEPWGFDPFQLAAAQAVQRRPPSAATVPVVWPPLDPPPEIDLDELIAFLRHSAKQFVKTRLRFSVPAPGDIPDDTLPTDLDGLERWSVSNRLLEGLAAGHPLDALERRERSSDALPPGDLGDDDLERAIETATALWDAAVERGFDPLSQRSFSGTVAVGDRVVSGAVTADHDREHLVTVTPSKLRAAPRLKAFTQMVFLSALEPETSWQAVLIGRHERFPSHVAIEIGPIPGDPEARRAKAGQLLAELVALYLEGHDRPLPMPLNTSYVWHGAHGNKGRNGALYEARKTWETDRFDPENEDPAHALVMPQWATIEALEEAGLGDYGARLWSPVFQMSRQVKI